MCDSSFLSKIDPAFYYAFPSFEQRLKILQRLVQSRDFIILVIGERGSGKTTLLNRFLVSADTNWRACRIQVHFIAQSANKSSLTNLNDHPAYILTQDPIPIIMFDDAHELNRMELKYLLQDALLPGGSQKLKRLVLFGEPQFMATLAPLLAKIAKDAILNKIYMPPLTETETAVYLRHRLAATGYIGKNPFKPSDIRGIHKASGGLPGRINEEAYKYAAGKRSYKNPLHAILQFGVLKRKPYMVWGIGATSACILAIFLLIFNRILPSFRTEHRIPYGDNQQVIKKAEKSPSMPILTPKEFKTKAAIIKNFDKSPPLETNQKQRSPLLTQSKKSTEKSSPKPSQKLNTKKQIYRENWLLAQNPAYYTIQVIGVRNEKSLLNFVENHFLRNQNPIAYFQTKYKGDDWYPLVLGIFSSQKNARSAMKELPEEIQKLSPWIRKIAPIQNAIKKNQSNKSQQTKPKR